MKTLKLLAILLLVGIFYSCESEDSEPLCSESCAEVLDYRGKDRIYSNGNWSYTFILTLKMECSGVVFEYHTRPYSSIGQVSRLTELCNDEFIKYN